MRQVHVLSLLAAGFASTSAGAQSFNYGDFSSATGLTFNGNAAVVGTTLRLTESVAVQKAAVWRTQPVFVDSGFDASITFRISNPVGGGADGIAFLIQNDPRATAAMGDASGDIGYGADPSSPPGTAITNSLAIEFDTFGGPYWNDPNHTHVSVHTGGVGANSAVESFALYTYPLAFDIGDGATHSAHVKYVPGTLEVSIDGATVISIPYSLASGGTWTNGSHVRGLSLINGTHAYVGFTAANSGSCETHDVLSWSWSSYFHAPSSYCTAGTSTNGCVPQISASENPSASFANPCTLNVASLDGQRSAIVFYGLTTALQPWASGSTSFLCVKAPTQRFDAQNTGGTPGLCDGSLSVDWNAFQLAHPNALGAPWSAGATAHCQAWYRDPPAPKTTGLSAAVTLTYLP